ncbi:MAG: 4-(cytidine 5'-diphospho)-2-C-methyl-D-erythritol kinase [Oscillospiraceae bacterium]|jgi:4-diphosphocytidyl-2-C-methyl-D-erythritol kinase|nr:4-(cytidine 5'-diphospho)-2-C-methyl-D-erythritol kinase [Oscillospiraceae bacterium]
MIHANAKINLSLDVLGTLPNGYHRIESVMTELEFGDTLSLEESPGKGVTFSSNTPLLTSTKRNNCVKAAYLFYAEAGLERSLLIDCRKRIPIGGGLGGSSAGAAAILRALNRVHNVFTRDELMRLGTRIGADVPFQIEGGTAFVTGTGDEITPLVPLRDEGIVVITPEFSSYTAKLFAAIDNNPPKMRPNTAALIKAVNAGELKTASKLLYNVFEDLLAPRERRMVSDAKNKLLDLGALGASMSGTGSAVFGLFGNMESANRAFSDLCASGANCFLTRAKRYDNG